MPTKSSPMMATDLTCLPAETVAVGAPEIGRFKPFRILIMLITFDVKLLKHNLTKLLKLFHVLSALSLQFFLDQPEGQHE